MYVLCARLLIDRRHWGVLMNINNFARRRLVLAGVLLLVVAVPALVGCEGGEGAAKQKGRRSATPIPVAVKTVEPGKADVYAVYPGRVRGKREVEVRSRVEGILLKRHYNQGAFVKKGQLLFTINPEPFKATVKQRKAQLAEARANLNQAQQVWQRVSQLYEANAVSEAERDEAHAQLETAQAAVALAKANLEAAQIKLDYTTVEATLSGVTSLQEVDVGALVTQGTLLTTITQLDPVHVLFAVPAEDALMRKKALAAIGDQGGAAATRAVTLILPSGEVYDQTGYVDFTQSTIDPGTGTVRLRAVFDNADRKLVPGRFVRVRIRLETRDNAVVIPNKAITDSQLQTRVYVVTDDNKAKPVPVELGPMVAGGRIIEEGLEPGDRVIVIGLGQVRPGAAVAIKPREKLALDGTPRSQKSAAATAGESATGEEAATTDAAELASERNQDQTPRGQDTSSDKQDR